MARCTAAFIVTGQNRIVEQQLSNAINLGQCSRIFHTSENPFVILPMIKGLVKNRNAILVQTVINYAPRGNAISDESTPG